MKLVIPSTLFLFSITLSGCQNAIPLPPMNESGATIMTGEINQTGKTLTGQKQDATKYDPEIQTKDIEISKGNDEDDTIWTLDAIERSDESTRNDSETTDKDSIEPWVISEMTIQKSKDSTITQWVEAWNSWASQEPTK